MRRLAFPLLPLLLSACLGPRPEAPSDAAISPPPDWREPSAGTIPPESAWWKGFGDPRLSALIERALSHNPKVAEGGARVMQARAQLQLARGEQGPELDFHNLGGYARNLYPTGAVTTSGDEPSLRIAWDLDFFGRLSSAKEAARAQFLASRAAKDAVDLAIASTTAQTYIALLDYDRRLAIAENTLAARAESLRVQKRLADTGYSSQLELRQAEAEYRATEELLPQVKLAVTQTENALSILVGDIPGAIGRDADGLSGLSVPPIPGGLPSSLLRRRPDIYAAEQAVVAADHSLDSARAAMLPDFALTGDVTGIIAAVLPNPDSTYLLGGSVLAPIFDSGRRQAEADIAAGTRDQAAFAYRDTVLEALREVENALAAVGRTEERRSALAAQVAAEQAVLTAATSRYRAGYTSYLSQIDAERALLAAQLSLADAEKDRFDAFVDLYRALGGGWRATDAPS